MKEELDDFTREALVKYRIERAEETLAEVPILQQNAFLSTAINRMYYASFYAASALLLKEHHNVSTHQGVKQQLGLHFIATGRLSRDLGKFFSQIFEARHSCDYDDFISTTVEEVAEYYPRACEFVAAVKALIGSYFSLISSSVASNIQL